MIKISRKMIWASLFIVVVAAGTFILIWLFRPGEGVTRHLTAEPEEKEMAEQRLS